MKEKILLIALAFSVGLNVNSLFTSKAQKQDAVIPPFLISHYEINCGQVSFPESEEDFRDAIRSHAIAEQNPFVTPFVNAEGKLGLIRFYKVGNPEIECRFR